MISYWFACLLALAAPALPPSGTPQLPAIPSAETPAAEETPPESPTAAEKIAELLEIIESDSQHLQRLESELEDPHGEYPSAEREFREIDEELERLLKELDAAKQASLADAIEKLTQTIASFERQRTLAKDRFDLAIEDRRTVREEIQTLRSKLAKDQAALETLRGNDQPTEPTSDASSPFDASHPDPANAPLATKSLEDDERDADKEDRTETKMEDSSPEPSEEVDEELREVEAEALAMEQEALQAAAETKSIEARIADLHSLVAQEQKELNIAKRKLDLAAASQQAYQQEIATRQQEGAKQEEISDLRKSCNEAWQRMQQARAEVAEINERLSEHRSDLGLLQSEHILALQEAKTKAQAADEAESRVESLRNPFAIRNILQWLLDHGPRLLAIIVGMFILNRIVWFFSTRSIQLISSGAGRGSKLERENRAKTLVGVFQNAASVSIFITGILMTLEEVGANITVLMGGVAVIGLAVAFGAQNLIKDYFYGFVMLLENQYMLNDTIRIGTVSGQVERITLRMTVLRDSNGIVHFIPNGTINSVSNETHGWSRAVCEIAVGYEEDIDQVMSLIRDVFASLQADPAIAPLMLDEPSEPAVDSLGESTMVIKSAVKTLPNKQGTVKQEWLRRIQSRFREAGIAPPYARRRLDLVNQSPFQNPTMPVTATPRNRAA